MSVVIPRYTVDDLESFPRDGNRYEILDGILMVTPAPSPTHELVLARIRERLLAYLGPRAEVFSHGAIQVRPRTHLEPDLLVAPLIEQSSFKTWSEVQRWWLAVEVSGRGSRLYDRDAKQQAYLALGVRESWRADLEGRSIEVLRHGDPLTIAHRDALRWQPPELGTPLDLDVAAIFEGVEGDE